MNRILVKGALLLTLLVTVPTMSFSQNISTNTYEITSEQVRAINKIIAEKDFYKTQDSLHCEELNRCKRSVKHYQNKDSLLQSELFCAKSQVAVLSSKCADQKRKLVRRTAIVGCLVTLIVVILI